MKSKKESIAFRSKPSVLIGQLNAIIDREFLKPDEAIDMDLVDECLEAIARLDNLVVERTQEELEEIKKNIIEKAEGRPLKILHPAAESFAASRSKTGFLRRKGGRIAAAVIAAALMASLFTVGTAAKQEGFDIKDWIKEILNIEPGTSMELGGVTVYYGPDYEWYESVDEFIEAGDLDILYPSVLPEGISLEKIFVYEMEGQMVYSFQFNSSSFSYEAWVDDSSLQDKIDSLHINDIYKVQIKDLCVYLWNLEDGRYQAMFEYGRYQYIVKVTDYIDINTIITNLKGRKE